MRLKTAQDLFWGMITGDVKHTAADSCMVGSAIGTAEQRVQIYADMYLWRLVDALRSDFPKVSALLGDQLFYSTAAAYVRAHPSQHPSVSMFGRHFAEFLSHYEPALHVRCDIASLAQLEWARTMVFDDADPAPIGTEGLAPLGATFVQARLRLTEALRVITSTYSITHVWHTIENNLEVSPVVAEAQTVAVWRKEFSVLHSAVNAAEAKALALAMAGETLGEVCEAFAECDNPSEMAFTTLSSWFADGWVEEIQIPR